ncbi:MAG: bifunctional pyr operon transcriptional regulator/uracil phosphoribosyltransferase PyrR [Opitutaceae bacterium]|nr:bifunctional pyr operon transcriptional regulator/uracil phosphoribosyltransferase PyrR [Opitutaceae bacterium]
MCAAQSLTAAEVHAAVDRLVRAISEKHRGETGIILLGIANGGITLARRLGARLNLKHVGTLDISFHRDDIGRNPIPKEFAPTVIPADVNGAVVILVDDVLFSGRTAKAALDELFDHGRPARVELAVLIDRGCHKLPITADFTGMSLEAGEDEKINVLLDPARPASDTVQIVAAKRNAR